VRRLLSAIIFFFFTIAAALAGGTVGSPALASSVHRSTVKARLHRSSGAKAKHPKRYVVRKRAKDKPALRRSSIAQPTRTATKATVSVPRLRFGIYPWAGAGTVNAAQAPKPDDPAQAMSAVRALQGSRSFTVHIYGQYTGADSAEADALVSDAKWWSDNGLRVEMVLRYRPARPELAAGYVPWVATVATRLAALPGLLALQIGNEANNTASAAAGDGAYPGAVDAIAHAIPVARQALVAAGRADVRVGLNWAAGSSPCTTEPMWSALRQAGGSAFIAAVGWVGVDVYPGTWSAPAQTTYPTTAAINATVADSLRCLRTRHMAAAGLGSSVTITVAETGYPTDADRSESTQASVLRATIASVQSVSRQYGVTDLRWFDLRDANTGSGQLENGYGLLRDDYTPKPAFAAFQQIIAAQGA
jgi:hypothetical protein